MTALTIYNLSKPFSGDCHYIYQRGSGYIYPPIWPLMVFLILRLCEPPKDTQIEGIHKEIANITPAKSW